MLVKKDLDSIRIYFEDASNLKGGHAEEVVFPENEDDLSRAVRMANETKTPVTISGGGTGTTGSRIPFGGIVISMERFTRIFDISSERSSSRLQSGVMVDDFKEACEKKDLFYASHPTEKTASVGGTVATNASGSRSFKYGPTRDYVERLKMVLASGEIFEIRRAEIFLKGDDPRVKLPGGGVITVPMPTYRVPVIKNSAGYYAKDGMDLIDLFIGQEGTLSIITEIGFRLVKKPARILSSFVFFKDERGSWDFSQEARTLSRSRRDPSIDALSIEYFDHNALALLRQKNKNVPSRANAAIFFEQEMDARTEGDTVEKWLALMSRHGVAPEDTWVAMNENDADSFTKMRHDIPESINDIVRRSGYQKLSTDIAVPESGFAQIMDFYARTLGSESIEHVVFGHIGECHVHINLLPKSENELARAREVILSFVKKGVELGGTVSAEHGVGKTKHKYLEMMYGAEGILEMARIKKAFDPNCILGLDNVFPREVLKKV